MTDTPTPEPTFTATPTATPTLDYFIELTTPAGEPARVSREISIADVWLIVIMSLVLFSMWIQHFITRSTEKDVAK